MSWIIIVLLIIGFLVIVYTTLTFMDRGKVYQQWNEILSMECIYQNETDRAFNNIPSLQSAWVCQNEFVREMHLSIFLIHSELLVKVEDYFNAMIECAEEDDEKTRRDNLEIRRKIKGGIRYFPFTINCNQTRLVETFGLSQMKTPAFNFGLLILEPGTTTPWRQSLSKGLYRYHYALKLPKEGEFGLYLRFSEEKDSPVHRIKWKRKQGFIWDATFSHSLANHSMEPCFLLVADIPRDLSWKHQGINNILHTYFPPSGSETSVDL